MSALWLLIVAVAGIVAYRRLATRLRFVEDLLAATETRLAIVERRRDPAPIAPLRSLAPVIAEPPPAVPQPDVAAPAGEPPADPAPDARGREAGDGGFEALVGGRLPIWVGGAALAVAGYFLVRLAIEAGLLGPWVRIALSALFGLALIAAAEGAAWLRVVRGDARIAQALAGAGIATLYAAAYLASAGYGLVGPGAAYLLMALVTVAALGLSLRHGAPAAIMGLIGGFATPLAGAIATTPIALVLVYLGLLGAGLFALAIRRGWLWLAAAATAGSLGWGGLLVWLARPADLLAVGLFVAGFALAAALATPAAHGTQRPAYERAILRGLPIAVALIELAALLPRTGFGAEGWALYLLLSAGAIGLARRDARLTPLVAGALALSTMALATDAAGSVPAAVAIALLFGGAGHALARRGDGGAWWAAIGGAALLLPWLIVRIDAGAVLPPAGWGALALVMSGAPLWLARASAGVVRTTALAVGATLLGLAAGDLLPPRLLPAALAAIALALAETARRADDARIDRVAAAAVAVTLIAIAAQAHGAIAAGFASLGGTRVLLPMLPPPGTALLAMLLPVPLLMRALRRERTERAGAALAAGVLGAGVGGAIVLVQHAFGIRDEAAFIARGFAERMLVTQALFAAGAVLARRRPATGIGTALSCLALARVLLLDLVLFDPAWVAQGVGRWPVANLLVAHFGLATWWTAGLWRGTPAPRRAAALAALIAVAGGGLALATRQAFRGNVLTGADMSRGEFWAYSAAGLALAAALLAAGARTRDRSLRIAGLALTTLVALKVFLVDAAALEGVLRILSFLGLGLALIGIGWAYGRFLGGTKPAGASSG